MHEDDCQCVLSITLPVTVGENLHAGFYLDQSRLGGWQNNVAREEKAGQSLLMCTAQAPSRQETRCLGLRRPHNLILNGAGSEGRRQRSWTMPIFEYICADCDHRFEALLYGNDQAACPKCHSKDLAPQLSVFAVSAKGSAATPSAGGACGACGDPRGPGACSRPDLN